MAVRQNASSGEKTTRTGQGATRPNERKNLNGSAIAAESQDHSNISNWQKIEILRERAELKRNLKEIWSDDVDIDDLSMAEDKQSHDRYYTRATEKVESLADFDDIED